MAFENFARLKEKFGKSIIIIPLEIVALILIFFSFINFAFPKVRCTAKHLDSPEAMADCYECHLKITPKVAQDWYESKHGIQLVKCFMCHGQPDGKGALPFAAKPAADITCVRCHDPSIHQMQAKFGLVKDCSDCHPFHQNSIHHATYVKPEAKKTLD
jgi:hypothetical protein